MAFGESTHLIGHIYASGFLGNGKPNYAQAQDLANARLIASAPDLLEACKISLVGADMMTPEQYEFITTAISKAEGKE